LAEPEIVAAAEGWMSFLCRTKVSLDSKVKLHAAAFKPASAAPGERGRLRHFDHAENFRIERASPGFPIGWHRQLNVIDVGESSVWHLEMLSDRGSTENGSAPVKIKD
jgi:hypothetical protein